MLFYMLLLASLKSKVHLPFGPSSTPLRDRYSATTLQRVGRAITAIMFAQAGVCRSINLWPNQVVDAYARFMADRTLPRVLPYMLPPSN